MNKKQVSLLLLSGLLLSGCVLGGGKQSDKQAGEVRVTEEKQEQTIKGSLKDLLGKVQGKKCSWSYQGEEMASSGTVYVGGEKMYSQMKMEVSAEEGTQQMAMEMINDGEYVYQWRQGSKQGTKIGLEQMEQMQQEGQKAEGESEAQVKNWQQEYEYQCSNWQVEESKFGLPTGVQFTDLTQMMQQTQEQVEQTQQDVCAQCNQLPAGEARQQCLQACQ